MNATCKRPSFEARKSARLTNYGVQISNRDCRTCSITFVGTGEESWPLTVIRVNGVAAA
jgi:hypothetical protein